MRRAYGWLEGVQRHSGHAREAVATGRAGESLPAAERPTRGKARHAWARRGAGSPEPVQSYEHDARVARVTPHTARAAVARPCRALRTPGCATGRAPAADSGAFAARGPAGDGRGRPYTCTGLVDNLRVVGTGTADTALVNLAAGCTGTISFDVTVTAPGGGDGVKVQDGAHDLIVGPSSVTCQPGLSDKDAPGRCAGAGRLNVTFKGLVVSCPSSPGAAAFYIDGKDFPGISNVTCDGCDLRHMVMGALFTAPAPGSGVRNSRIHQGTTTNAYHEIVGSGAINEDNKLVPRA